MFGLTTNRRLDFLEIGTSDYDTEIERATHDTVGISVEPVRYYLSRLPDRKRVRKVHAAVADRPGTSTVYYVPDTVIRASGLPDWVRGCSCLGKHHPTVLKLFEQLGIPPTFAREDVDVTTVEALLAGHSGLDYLKIYTEGMDAVIMSSYVDYVTHHRQMKARRIKFECNSLSDPAETDRVVGRLIELGYTILRRSEDDVTLVDGTARTT